MADKMKSKGSGGTSSKALLDQKLKMFNQGTMNVKKNLSKREQDEQRKRLDQEEAAQVFEEFVASFEDAGKLNKAWVKGGLTHPERNEKADKPGKPGSRIYKPTSKLAELASTFKSVQEAKKTDDDYDQGKMALSKKKIPEKKKTNLELFKEELRVIQEQRDERRRLKKEMGILNDDTSEPNKKSSRFEPVEDLEEELIPPSLQVLRGPDEIKGSFNYDDVQTTNIYLGNINPKMTEQQLCEIFGKYGPLASVKIMWPRSDEERARGRNCGFVAFMNRKDGERAMNAIQGKDIMSFEMKLGWGKAVPIPPHPVYIPPSMVEMALPPPPSGLPFNAQPQKPSRQSQAEKKYGNVPPPDGENDQSEQEDPEKTLANAVVKVVIPTERNLLVIIHRMIEFVVREGPMFEAMIMNREMNNPLFSRFLFENQSPAHVYYRWKLYSILQGDSPHQWRTDDYRMFKTGSLWRPPPLNPYTQGMPEELVNKPVKKDDGPKKGQLSESQRDRFEDMLRELTPERTKIGDAMVWCLEHAESAEEIVECIAESLSILQTPIPKKIARLFLISDILFNCSAKVPNASFFRKRFEDKLPEIFKDIHDAYENIDARLKAEQFKQKVMGCFRAWEDWAVYPNEYLINLQNVFLGLVPIKDEKDGKELDLDGAPIELDPALEGRPLIDMDYGDKRVDSDLDGHAMEDYSIDGAPIREPDVDGDPYKEDIDGQPFNSSGRAEEKNNAAKFKYEPSRWETVDQSELEAQAFTTSKWDILEQDQESSQESEEEDIDGQPFDDQELQSPETAHDNDDSRGAEDYDYSFSNQREMTEERRAKLREIEVKVMKYQDELEAGKRSRKSDLSVAQQVEYYRKKLLQKEQERERDKEREKKREGEREKIREWERAREKEREREKDRHGDRGQIRSERSRERDGRDRERDRRERSTSSEKFSERYDTPSSLRRLRRSESSSPARSPHSAKNQRSRSPVSPPAAYKDSPPSRRKRHRSKSPKKSSRSSTPKKKKRSRSRSRSPSSRSKHKHKKDKR